jgi:hypothetical protein
VTGECDREFGMAISGPGFRGYVFLKFSNDKKKRYLLYSLIISYFCFARLFILSLLLQKSL